MIIQNFSVINFRFYCIIIKYGFISGAPQISAMITEAISIALILGACAAAALFAKSRFHSEIERSLARLEAEGEAIVARRKLTHN